MTAGAGRLSLRPYTAADLDRVWAFFDRISHALYSGPDDSREQLERWLTSPRIDPARDVRLVFDSDRLVGYADLEDQETASWTDIRVDLDADVRAIVAELLGWAEQRAGRGVLRTFAPSALPAQQRAYEAAGYRYIRSSYRMEIDLDAAPDAPALPAGLELGTLRPGGEHAVYVTFHESFKDTWEFVPLSFEEWKHFFVETDEFDPALWLLAWDEAELAGVALCAQRASSGWVRVLAVRRPWRRQGLGRALLVHAFRTFYDRGTRIVGLGVDAESPTGAQHLYEQAGMHVARRTDLYEKRLG